MSKTEIFGYGLIAILALILMGIMIVFLVSRLASSIFFSGVCLFGIVATAIILRYIYKEFRLHLKSRLYAKHFKR